MDRKRTDAWYFSGEVTSCETLLLGVLGEWKHGVLLWLQKGLGLADCDGLGLRVDHRGTVGVPAHLFPASHRAMGPPPAPRHTGAGPLLRDAVASARTRRHWHVRLHGQVQRAIQEPP